MYGNDRTDLVATVKCVLYACHVQLHTNVTEEKLPLYLLREGIGSRRELHALNCSGISERPPGGIARLRFLPLTSTVRDIPRRTWTVRTPTAGYIVAYFQPKQCIFLPRNPFILKTNGVDWILVGVLPCFDYHSLRHAVVGSH